MTARLELQQLVQIYDGPSGALTARPRMTTARWGFRHDGGYGSTGTSPDAAAKAAKSVRAKIAVPQHYDIAENATAFAAALKKLQVPFYEMKPGETISFRGKLMLRK